MGGEDQRPDLNKYILQVKPSPTVSAAARARELKAKGRDIISFGIGEPDFDTPDHVKKAAVDALNRGFTKYTAADGIIELKHTFIKKLETDQHMKYAPGEIIVTNGGKHALAAIAAVLLNAGDEVIIPAPYWTSYPDIMALTGGVSVIVNTGPAAGYLMTPEQLVKAVTPKTKIIVLCSPSNPTGAAYSTQELRALADAYLKLPNYRNIMIVSDEVYEYFSYDGVNSPSILEVAPELKPNVVIVNSMSKSYSMTGWRVGFAAGPKWLIDQMGVHQSQFTTNVCSIAQAAAVVAFSDGGEFPRKMLTEFSRRRQLVVEAVKEMPGVTLPVLPKGAFYAFLRIEGLFGKRNGDFVINCGQDFATYLLEKYDLATVQGEAFGDGGAIRVSYALATNQLQAGLERIKKAVSELK